MNIIQSGTSFRVFDESITTHEKIPAGVYNVNFHPMEGYSLVQTNDLVITDNKVYGGRYQKADKIIHAFSKSQRNLGVLLSGAAGTGKTMFTKILAQKAIEQGIPILLVNSYIGGIAGYLASIDQEVCVIFDEFEKIYQTGGDDDNSGAQKELLTLFDGMTTGKKLFCITCNELNRISKFMINRPGRIHYHIKWATPTKEEVKEYLIDNVEQGGNIEGIETFSTLAQTYDFTYDALRAIAFELSLGESVKSILTDLNITAESYIDYKPTLINASENFVVRPHAISVSLFLEPDDYDYDDDITIRLDLNDSYNSPTIGFVTTRPSLLKIHPESKNLYAEFTDCSISQRNYDHADSEVKKMMTKEQYDAFSDNFKFDRIELIKIEQQPTNVPKKLLGF